jgi:hypothetical protein
VGAFIAFGFVLLTGTTEVEPWLRTDTTTVDGKVFEW